MRTATCAIAATVLLVLSACSSSAQQAGQMAPTDVVATVGSIRVTLGDVDEIALQQQASDFGGARLVQALYVARRMALDEIVSNHLLDLEAGTRGIDRATLVDREISAHAPAPTEADISFWYQAHPERVQGAALTQLRGAIKALLQEERLDEARTSFINSLKDKTAVTIALEPPRQTIVTDGHPAKGPKDAPIEIVEFSDFQCPFCQRAEPTVERVLKTYGDRVRFIYRHYPLPNHPDARPAAEASACAHEQGRFWEFHRVLFANTSRLGAADLKAHGVTAGLDAARFAACVDGREQKARVERDLEEAGLAGVTGTPAFFINGRALEGAQPYDAFKRMIDEELALRKK